MHTLMHTNTNATRMQTNTALEGVNRREVSHVIHYRITLPDNTVTIEDENIDLIKHLIWKEYGEQEARA